MIGGTVCNRNWSKVRMTEYQEARLFQRMNAATGNERRPTAAIDDMSEPAAGVMRMSADDDVQADQQHELADPAETGRSVLNTPGPKLYSRHVVANAAG